MTEHWYHLTINPEPWAVGSLGIGKKQGKFYPYMGANPQLNSYKEAVAEELAAYDQLAPGEYELEFYFWRVLDDYETGSGRRHRKHLADTTNLQKATEDALQGVLIDNDRNVRRISSEIVEQGPGVKPGIVIHATWWGGFNPDRIPQHMWNKIDAVETLPNEDRNAWPPTEGF